MTCCVPSLPKLFARRVVRGDPRADRAAGVCSGGRDGRGLRVRVSAIARASSACFSSCTVRGAFASASRSSRPSLSHYRQTATAPPFPHEQTRSTPPATASFCPFDGPARAIRCACAITGRCASSAWMCARASTRASAGSWTAREASRDAPQTTAVGRPRRPGNRHRDPRSRGDRAQNNRSRRSSPNTPARLLKTVSKDMERGYFMT